MRFKIAARFDIVDIDVDSDFENDSVAPAEMNEFIGERDFFLRRHCEPTGPREARPDDRLREAIHPSAREAWIASSLRSSQ
jgi:hypothetical protein